MVIRDERYATIRYVRYERYVSQPFFGRIVLYCIAYHFVSRLHQVVSYRIVSCLHRVCIVSYHFVSGVSYRIVSQVGRIVSYRIAHYDTIRYSSLINSRVGEKICLFEKTFVSRKKNSFPENVFFFSSTTVFSFSEKRKMLKKHAI